MAQTYEVGLRYTGGDAASRALRDADAIDSAMNKLERRRGGAALFKGADWSKTAQMAAKAEDAQLTSQLRMEAEAMRSAERIASQQERQASRQATAAARASAASMRAAEKERTAQLRLDAEAMRSAKRLEDQKRNAAFRRLQAQQREEERFTRYRISLMKKEELARQRAAAKAGASVKPQGGAFGNMLSGLGGGLIAGGAGAAAVAGAAYVGGQALDAVKLIESARMRLTTSLGSVERANREMKDAFKIAEKTVFDPDEMVMAMARLATYFKDDTTRRYILGSVADFATQSGMGTEGLNRAIKAITDIKSKGALQAEELKTQLGDLGLSGEEVKQEIAKLLNLKGKTDQERNEKVMKLMQKGAVQAEVGIQAITTVMRKQAGGGKAGAFSVKSADSLEGKISNIKKGLLTMFVMADIDKWPAMISLKNLLGDISDLFASDSKTGAQMMSMLKFYTTGVVTVLGLMAKAIGFVMRPLFRLNFKIVETISKIEDYNFQGFFDIGAWRRMGSDIIIGLGEGISSYYGYLYDIFSKGVSWLVDKAVSLGTDIGKGLARGLSSVKDQIINAVKGNALAIPEQTAETLQIRSPSRKMMALGRYAGEGFALGIDQSSRSVTDASMSLTDAISTGGVRGSGGAGSSDGGVKVYISLPLQTTGSDPAQIAREVGPLLGAQIEMQLDRYLGRLVSQGA